MLKLLLSSCAFLLLATAVSSGSAGNSVPVLVELFTSEGCSSCPPADRLLASLDKTQPIPGVDVIVLSEHVDYWNHLGWADPFSSSAYTARQREYARRLNGEVYTPQAVVDGAQGLVGSEEKELYASIRQAASLPKASLAVQGTRRGDETSISIHGQAAKGSLFIALARDAAQTQVLRGENSGRKLSHVGVVYSLKELARLDGRSDIDREISLKAEAGSRIVAFVSAGGRVIAAGHTRL